MKCANKMFVVQHGKPEQTEKCCLFTVPLSCVTFVAELCCNWHGYSSHLSRSPCKKAILKHGNPIGSDNIDSRGIKFDNDEHYKHAHFA